MTIEAWFDKATSNDAHLPWFDHTVLKSINECPTWGMFRYGLKLKLSDSGRAMALEAGLACHEVFAAVRLLDMLRHQPACYDHFHTHGSRIFGPTRWQTMTNTLGDGSRQEAMAFCLQALYDSGFYDDPRDKRRTMSKLEECCIAYIDRWPWGMYPVWVMDEHDPNAPIGVEIPINVVVTLQKGETRKFRLVGRADGLHWHKDQLVLHENKTASRLDDAFTLSFLTSHQITGYIVGLSAMLSIPIERAMVHGLSIPLPKSYDFGGVIVEPVRREEYQIRQWIDWLWDTIGVYNANIDNPDGAVRYTHSCNRYFRPCSMIPYCNSDDEERALIRTEMVPVEWDPLEDKTRY